MSAYHVPIWKRMCSWIFDWVLEQSGSEYNPELTVILSRGKLQLCTGNAIYSQEDRYENFRLLFDQIGLEKLGFRRVVVLGLGLGSIPLLIDQRRMKLDKLDLVEIDEEVVRMAERFILHRISTPYTTYITDALRFLKLQEQAYDLIISDIFVDDEIPDPFLGSDYLHLIRSRLSPGGMVIINTLAGNQDDRDRSKSWYDQTFLSVFPEGSLRHVWENFMLIGKRRIEDSIA